MKGFGILSLCTALLLHIFSRTRVQWPLTQESGVVGQCPSIPQQRRVVQLINLMRSCRSRPSVVSKPAARRG